MHSFEVFLNFEKLRQDYKIEFTKLKFGFFPDFCRHIVLGSTLNTAYYVLHPQKGNTICIFYERSSSTIDSVCSSFCTPLAVLYMAIVHIIYNDSNFFLETKRGCNTQ